MRIRPHVTREQRKALKATAARLQQPEVALEIVRSSLDAGIEPESVVCTVETLHPDRFVMRVRVRSVAGEWSDFAWKVYADDFGARMWALARTLAEQDPTNHTGLCLPRRYLHGERTLVFPWVDGVRLSDIVDDRKPDLLRRAAELAADLHRTPPDGLPALTPEMVVAEALHRCRRLQSRCPSMSGMLISLMRQMEAAAAELEPAQPAMIHGDMAAGQFLWTGDRLVLLDLDAAGRADPAYDVGHFLGQLERRCLRDLTLPGHSRQWLACFREAYAAKAVGVSWRNVSFFQGVTLVRKMFTVSQRDAVDGPPLAARLAERARAAFESVVTSR